MSSPLQISLGPVMLDVAGTQLTEDDRVRLVHPLVGGVILFSRNYASPEQLTVLCEEIHAMSRRSRQAPTLSALCGIATLMLRADSPRPWVMCSRPNYVRTAST